MEQERDYIRDISEIRSIMERSTKFLSLSGWAGILIGIYALVGVYLAYTVFEFNPQTITDPTYADKGRMVSLINLILLAIVIILMAIGTAILLSRRTAIKKNEKSWNATSKRLLINMFVPLVAGGLLILALIANGLVGLVAPLTLIFYGLSLYIASKFTYDNLKVLGLADICLGLIGAYFIGYSLLLWAIGFGVGHIVYGIYVHFKYEK